MSNKPQVLIIEDEQHSAKKLKEYLFTLRPGFELLAVLSSVEESVSWLQAREHPQIIFLDIHLSDGLSFQIFEQLEVDAHVIFLTAYEQYAVRAFDLNSIDYVLKPFDEESIRLSLEKYDRKTEYTSQLINQRISQLHLEAPVEKTRFMVKKGNKIGSVPVADIAYFYKDSLVFLVSKSGEKYMVDYTLEQLEGLLNMRKFYRLNRQFISSFESIGSVDRIANNRLKVNLKPQPGTDVIISQNKSTRFKEWLNL